MIAELLRNRYRPRVATREWFRYWGKRVFLTRAIVTAHLSSRRYARCCEAFGKRTTISPSKIDGRLELLRIGDNCAIGRVTMQLHARVTIGNNVVINDGCQLITGTHDIHSPHWELIAEPIVIEDYAWIATDAMLLPGVTIGRGAVVGARAVVTRSVEAYQVMAGNPARPIGWRRAREFCYRPSESVALFEAWLGPAGRRKGTLQNVEPVVAT